MLRPIASFAAFYSAVAYILYSVYRHNIVIVEKNEDMKNRLAVLVESTRTRASIRRGTMSRKSVQEGKPDRIADLLEEMADAIEKEILS